MYRCFANNNIIPIKSSKEHMEDKRNNAMFCNYAKRDHWQPTKISDSNLEKKNSNLFSVNGSNKIVKAKNHTEFLNLSKGLFNRKLLLHANTLKNKDFWSRTRTLDTIKNRNMLTVYDLSGSVEEFNKPKIHNAEDFHYYNGNQINDLNYLKLNTENQTFSSFAVISHDNLTINDMDTHKKKIIPFCFNLHNSYTLPIPTATSEKFGVGFELFGNFDKTTDNPRKSNPLLNIIMQPTGRAQENSNWDTQEKAFKWGESKLLDGQYENWGGLDGNDNDSLDITGIGGENLEKTNEWSLIMDIKFEGNPLDNDPFPSNGDDDNILFLFRSFDETSNQATESGIVVNAKSEIDQGVALINGKISLADITFTEVLKKGTWYTLAFSFNYTNTATIIDVFMREENSGAGYVKLVEEADANTIDPTKAQNIVSIGDKIELFKQTYTDTPVNTSDDGWIKNIYFTKNQIIVDDIQAFKENEYNPID